MIRAAALVCALSLACAPALAFEGDGQLSAKGPTRLELDLGPVDLNAKGRREYNFKDLPEHNFLFGLRLTAPAGQRLRHLPSATVRLRLLNEREDVLFEVQDDLPNWLRNESTSEWFLYLRGLKNGGTDIKATPSTSYRLIFETLRADSTMSKFNARLVGVGSVK